MMIRRRNTTKRSGAILATGALAVLGTALIAAPASADSDDIDITKTADVTNAAAGDTVTYTVEVRGSDLIDLNDPGATSDTDVQIFDQLPPHMTFVPDSAEVTFSEVSAGAATHLVPNSYAGGTGWTGPWIETNDDGVQSTGDLQAGALALRMRNPSGPLPELTRTVDPAGTVRSVAFSFASADLFTGANDQVIAEMSVDGGSTWPYSETITGGDGLEVHTLVATGVSADTITIRFRVLTTGTWGAAQAILVSGISVLYAYDTSSTTTQLVDGDILDGFGNLTVGVWDVSYAETVTLTYQMTVNDVIEDTTTLVTNVATATSLDDPVGESDSYDLILNRNPDFDVTVTNNGPVHVGDPLILTATIAHSAASDGYPLCSAMFQSNTPPNFNFTLISGDLDSDDCIDYGETWVLSKTFTDRTTTAGAFSLELGLFGDGPGQGEEDISLAASDDYTVVLADSGAPDESVTMGASAALILLGASMLVYTRRRLA